MDNEPPPPTQTRPGIPSAAPSTGHAVVSGSPGEGARVMGLFRVMWPIFLLLLFAGVVIGLSMPLRLPPIGGLLGVLGVLVALAAVMIWSDRRLERYFKGAQGEEMIARTLGFLPPEYHVYHSLWLPATADGPSDVDHLVVGPTGVFVLETKNWRGLVTIEEDRVLIDGKSPSRPPLQQVYRAARSTRSWLQEETGLLLKVSPLLCFAAGDGGFEEEAAGVLVCDGSNLLDLLCTSRGEDLEAEKIERIVAVLDQRK